MGRPGRAGGAQITVPVKGEQEGWVGQGELRSQCSSEQVLVRLIRRPRAKAAFRGLLQKAGMAHIWYNFHPPFPAGLSMGSEQPRES